MKKTNLLLPAIAFIVMIVAGCSKSDDNNNPVTPTDKPVKTVTGTLSGNITWDKDTVYKLSGYVRVGADDGTTMDNASGAKGTLTIEAGTIIIGEKASKGTLIIQRGSKLIAEGTAANPIIFTSEKAQGARAPGDWGGLVICGLAPINIAGGHSELEGGYGAYFGGNIANDNSGILKYVRVEYAGIAINPNQEINTFTFGGVGSGTTLSYLQASYAGDDSYEWFGGTVNADHLIAYRGTDDDFDTDNGYSGKVQFGLGVRDKNIADYATGGASNGFESDNDATSSSAAPFTSAEFCNMTIIGPKKDTSTTIGTPFKNAALIRRNSRLKIYNSVLIGYPNGISIDGATTIANAQAGDVAIKNTVIAGTLGTGNLGYFVLGDINIPSGQTWASATWSTVKDWYLDATFHNSIAANNRWDNLGIQASVFDIDTPNFLPIAGASILSGAGTFSGFTGTTYIGAFGTDNWTNIWANFNPSVTKYL